MPSRRVRAHTPTGVYGPPLRLREFDWENLVEGRFFESMLIGIIGVIVGLVSISSAAVSVPPWLLIEPWLSVLCVLLAFARTWKTIREEHETAPLWGAVEAASDENGLILDRVFEIPYLFTLTVMPIAALSPQLFMTVLIVFYFCDNFYNAGLARGAERPNPDQSYGAALVVAARRIFWLSTRDVDGGRRDTLIRYFRRRSHYDSVIMLVLVAGLVAVTLLTSAGDHDRAVWLAGAVLLGVLLFEVFLEPMRNRGMFFAPESDRVLSAVNIDDVSSRAAISDSAIDRLTAIHEAAFGPDEQQYTMADMLARAGSDDGRLRVISRGGELVGYLYLELAPEKETAFLWYVAIAEDHRSGGLGGQAVRDTLNMMSDDERLKYMLFEVHSTQGGHAGHEPAASDIDRRRIAFYRRLGAYWVRNVDYRIPAADDPSASIQYDPMFFALRGGYDNDEIAERIALMAQDNFTDMPGDPRWQALRESLPNLKVVAPGDGIEPG